MKKLIAILTTFTLTAGLFMPVSSARLCGDINGDGEINSLDIISMIIHLNGSQKLTGEDFITANTYTYGETFAKVDSQDLVALIQYVFKQIKALPVDSEPVTTTRATTTTTTTTTTARTTTTKVTAPTVGFNPQIYVDYAREYGTSIGLVYDRNLVGDGGDNPLENASWGTPIIFAPTQSDESTKRLIRECCDYLVMLGYKQFWAEVFKASDLDWLTPYEEGYLLFVYQGSRE